MSANNRTPLGFGTIFLFHFCVLLAGVALQNLTGRSWSGFVFGMTGAAAVAAAIHYRAFLWDIFRSFRSAVILLSFLVLSCVLGTLIVQDLDMRREGKYAQEGDMERGPDGKPPPFDPDRQPGRFAFCQSTLLIRLVGDETLERNLAKNVVLTPGEERQYQEQKRAFGERAGEAWKKGLLKSKESRVRLEAVREFAKRHYDALYSAFVVCKRVHLLDIYESWWFYALLGLIGVNVIGGTLARRPWNVRDFGLAVTHAGVITILVGALVDRLAAREGYIHFRYGDPQRQVASSIYDQKNQETTELNFRVHLDRFATEYYHELLVQRYDHARRNDGSPHTGDGPNRNPFWIHDLFPVREGVTREFEDRTVKLRVDRYLPRVRVVSSLREREDGRLDPALRLGLYNHPTKPENLFYLNDTNPLVFALHNERSATEAYRRRFEYRWVRDEAEYRAILAEPPVPDNGTLTIRFAGRSERVPVLLQTERTVTVGALEMKIRFEDVSSQLEHGMNVNLDRRLQSDAPVLYLRLNDSDEFEIQRGEQKVYRDAELRFEWADPRQAGTLRLFRIVEGEGFERVLVQADEYGHPVTTPLRPEKRVPLEGGGFFAVEQAIRSAAPSRVVEEVTDDEFLRTGGGAEDDLLAAWAVVTITGPWGEVKAEMTPYDPPIAYGPPNEPPLYSFSLYRNADLARDWFSVLSVVDRDGKAVKTHRVQVNHPLRYEGYRFFQATAGRDEGLAVSGISVTFQPGVTYMYIGYTVLTLGVCWIFFLKPILVRRFRRKRAEAIAS